MLLTPILNYIDKRSIIKALLFIPFDVLFLLKVWIPFRGSSYFLTANPIASITALRRP